MSISEANYRTMRQRAKDAEAAGITEATSTAVATSEDEIDLYLPSSYPRPLSASRRIHSLYSSCVANCYDCYYEDTRDCGIHYPVWHIARLSRKVLTHPENYHRYLNCVNPADGSQLPDTTIDDHRAVLVLAIRDYQLLRDCGYAYEHDLDEYREAIAGLRELCDNTATETTTIRTLPPKRPPPAATNQNRHNPNG